jgi:hypothetical protein
MENKENIVVVSPFGFISFPALAAPDTGRPESTGKYSAELYVSQEDFRKDGKQLVDALLSMGAILKGRPVTLNDFKHTLTNIDTLPADKREKIPEAVRSGYIRIRAYSQDPIVVKDASANVMNLTDVAKIKGGDICRFVLGIYIYNKQGGGVGLGLNGVQYKQTSHLTFGGARNSGVDLLTAVDVQVTNEGLTTGFGSVAPAAQTAPANDFSSW